MNTYRYRSFTVAKHDSHSIVSCRQRQRESGRERDKNVHSLVYDEAPTRSDNNRWTAAANGDKQSGANGTGVE